MISKATYAFNMISYRILIYLVLMLYSSSTIMTMNSMGVKLLNSVFSLKKGNTNYSVLVNA